jgi:hypothetical protein
MKVVIPSIYKKTIFDIDYNSLKEMGIKCLIFDLDNTLTKIDNNIPSDETVKLVKKLKKDFQLYILTNNNNKERLDEVSNNLDIPYVSFALKPSKIGFKKILKKVGVKENEVCVIGDQIVTDIIGGNRLKSTTILVDPLGVKDLKITSFNRFVEKKIIKKLEKKKLFKKGEYYDKR